MKQMIEHAQAPGKHMYFERNIGSENFRLHLSDAAPHLRNTNELIRTHACIFTH